MDGLGWEGYDVDDDGGGFDFLPQVDEALLGELAFDPPSLENSSDGAADETPTNPPPPRRRRKRPNKLHMELMSLQEDCATLESQLALLEQTYAARIDTSSPAQLKWQQIARGQLQLKLKALRENELLRATVREQTELQRVLETTVLKKPRLMMMKLEDDQWRVLKLSANGSKRLTAIHSIADRQLETIEGDMITTGLIAGHDELQTMQCHHKEGGNVVAEGLRCTTFHGALDAVARAAWKTLVHFHTQPKSPDLPRQFYTYSIDDNTMYIRATLAAKDGKTKVESSVILKQLVTDDSVRIVSRSILEDDAMPFDADSYVSDQVGWAHMERGPAPDTVVYKSYVRAKWEMPRPGDWDSLRGLVGAAYVTEEDGYLAEHAYRDCMDEIFRAICHEFDAILQAKMATEEVSPEVGSGFEYYNS